MYEVGFFENLPPMEGSLSAVRKILKMFPGEVYVLTQPVSDTYYSYSEKAAWIKKWFPELKDKIIMTQEKDLISPKGNVLIDDNAKKWKDKWEIRGGHFYWFCESLPSRFNWSKVVTYLEDLLKPFEEIQKDFIENELPKVLDSIQKERKGETLC